GVEGAEVLVDRGADLAGGLAAALGGEVGPERGVVDVAAEVEREVLLVQVDRGEVAGLAGLGELLQGGVRAGDVGLVVLGVVQLHDPPGDVRLERTVVVGQLGQGVDGHLQYLLATWPPGASRVTWATIWRCLRLQSDAAGRVRARRRR